MDNRVEISIQKLFGKDDSIIRDSVAVEEPLEIWLKTYTSTEHADSQLLVTTMRTPGDDVALVRGWILSTGLVSEKGIQSIEPTGTERLKVGSSNRVVITLQPGLSLDPSMLKRIDYVNSSCGVCGQQSIEFLLDSLPEQSSEQRMSLPLSQINQLVGQLNEQQRLFAQTGGCHGAGLFDETAFVLDVKEDVGRHNALDKLIGANTSRLPGKFGVVLSGRVSFELVHKAAMAGITMIVAVGAPTSLAVDLCKECDICLIGFVKQNSLNVYHDNRQLAQY